MPEHFRALFVVVVLAAMACMAARPTFTSLFGAAEFTQRWSAWFLIMLVPFLAQNAWVYVFVTCILLYFLRGREGNIVALYLMLLTAVCSFRIQIPGFGLVNYLFEINHVRLLSLFLLLPAYWALRRASGIVPFGAYFPDKIVLVYIIYTTLMNFRGTTVTDSLRYLFLAFLEIFLPYYVASRAVQSRVFMREALGGFVMGAMVLGIVALFENLKGWLLFSSVPAALQADGDMGDYISRGSSIRAVATTGHSLVLGYLMMVALALFSFLRCYVHNAWERRVIFAFLIAGLGSAMSRGPWLGVCVFLGVLCFFHDRPLLSLLKLLLSAIALAGALVLMPGGEKFIDLLPYVGTTDVQNVEYRETLLENSMIGIRRNPWFGSVNYRQSPEMLSMVQGQGIVDVVNTYLRVALEFGLVGLSMFSSFFLSVLYLVRQGFLRVAQSDKEMRVLGGVLFAALVAVLAVIYTTSSILLIPLVYWSLAGLGVAYFSLVTRRATA